MGKKQKSSLVKHGQPKRQNQGGASKQGSGGGGGQNQKASVFRVSSHKALKAKHKTKQVTSNLKWMKSKSSKEQVSKSNASFSSVQQSLTATSSKQAQNQANKQVIKKAESKEQVDMDAAVLQMASL